jgi:hypothetical protein
LRSQHTQRSRHVVPVAITLIFRNGFKLRLGVILLGERCGHCELHLPRELLSFRIGVAGGNRHRLRLIGRLGLRNGRLRNGRRLRRIGLRNGRLGLRNVVLDAQRLGRLRLRIISWHRLHLGVGLVVLGQLRRTSRERERERQ